MFVASSIYNPQIGLLIVFVHSEIGGSGCRGSIRLVKSVCLIQFSDFIIIKIGPKSIFYMKFGRKSTKFHVFQINLIIRFVGYPDLGHVWGFGRIKIVGMAI